jgi:sugar lactone lactonase YvrE
MTITWGNAQAGVGHMKPTVWDSRKCHVGEGPVAIGPTHSRIHWVDILNNKILWRDLETNESGEIPTSENVSFVLPRINGGLVLGTAHGPELLNPDGTMVQMPGRFEADGEIDPIPMRWNDAKVGPCGEIWIGTSAYGAESELIGLHKITPDGKSISRVLSKMALSNGLDWSPDGKIFYLIDTVALVLLVFDYHNGEISNQREAIRFSAELDQYPDGMCVASDGSLWIAFWNGSCIRRYSQDFELIESIEFPAKFVSSCAFVGPDLKQLVVTTSTGDNGWHDEQEYAGMTFLVETDVTGKAPYVFSH